MPGLVARVNEMNSTALRRRTKMMLPAPQVRRCCCRRPLPLLCRQWVEPRPLMHCPCTHAIAA